MDVEPALGRRPACHASAFADDGTAAHRDVRVAVQLKVELDQRDEDESAHHHLLVEL